MDVGMDIEPLERSAGLPAVDERPPEKTFSNRLGVGIGQDYACVIAAQFERQPLEGGCGRRHDLAPGGDGARKDNFGDIGVGGEDWPDAVVTRYAVEHACWQDAVQYFDHAQRAERGEGRWFDDASVACQHGQ